MPKNGEVAQQVVEPTAHHSDDMDFRMGWRVEPPEGALKVGEILVGRKPRRCSPSGLVKLEGGGADRVEIPHKIVCEDSKVEQVLPTGIHSYDPVPGVQGEGIASEPTEGQENSIRGRFGP